MTRLTKEEFTKRAIKIHGYKYDYSLVQYINVDTKVCIVCPEHGGFWQTPNNHLYNKRGCPKCGPLIIVEKQRFTFNDFLNRARNAHGDKYDYSLVNYNGATTPVCIISPKHGEFQQKPHHHFDGHGCPDCKKQSISITQSSNREQFIKNAILIHGDTYNYEQVVYKNAHEKVCIICPEHGEFWQRPNGHLNGYGCQLCAVTGLNRSLPGFVYIVADDKNNPTLIKIGVTNNTHRRIQQLKRNTPFKLYKIFQVNLGTGQQSYDLEQTIHRNFQYLNAGLTGFDGCTEWFHYSPEILEYVKIILDGLHGVGLHSVHESCE
ncbi:hypothetical protein SP069_00360 [Salmonella phage SP069]|uniref:Bacteriophage T5 Orf172 DNA-binding domain-containing protein n=2 Tax=Nonanavirus TaxID=1921122 RepID=S4TRP1_9CAUD|nr:hypothetical protein QII00_sBgp08 [Salmonella phage SP069]AGF89288.1 hypothetical protein SP062_00040 [Salmonella phage FSL SP-062]AGF89571.1 hypothetical protein SP069_00360 [Salmonella phage SP069]